MVDVFKSLMQDEFKGPEILLKAQVICEFFETVKMKRCLVCCIVIWTLHQGIHVCDWAICGQRFLRKI